MARRRLGAQFNQRLRRCVCAHRLPFIHIHTHRCQVEISWLSAFPGEKEVLFPPLTFLKPTGRAEVVEGYTFVEVAPTVA